MEVLAVCFVVGWLLRIAFEDGVAAIRGTESPRITRQRARQEMARASGVPTIGQAAAARFATVIAPSPDGQRRRHPALEYVRARWEAAWDELLESHNEEMQRRAWARRERQAREAEERLRRERDDTTDPDATDPYADVVDAEVVDRPRCSACGQEEVDTAGDKCPPCSCQCRSCQWRRGELEVCPCGSDAVVADGLCADCLDPPNLVCTKCGYRHMEGGPCPDQSAPGWRETTGGAQRDGGDHHEEQDGEAWYRRWVQPHPRGDGRLRTTVTSWAQDNGERRWIVTETEWSWIGDNPDNPLFEDYDLSYSSEDGPSSEPWPTAEDVRRTVDDIQQPADPGETPLADVLDASLCPGGCGTWVVDGMCVDCENRRALPASETPEPDQGPGQHDPDPDRGPAATTQDSTTQDSTTQDSTDSGTAAHEEGTPMTQTAYINPDIVGADGALRCAEGSLGFTVAVRRQMEKLGANAERGLGDVPAVDSIRGFESDIAATAHTIDNLVAEHIEHVRTQAELAGDENLKNAAVGYLAATHR